jgi:hypothetical protein
MITMATGLAPDDPFGVYLQAQALRGAFPDWSIAVRTRAGGPARIEAVNRDGGDPYCLISPDPGEIWRELRAATGDRSGGGGRESNPPAARSTARQF